jgi:hypothetical protein
VRPLQAADSGAGEGRGGAAGAGGPRQGRRRRQPAAWPPVPGAGHPAVKASRDGAVADEFVGALPPPKVEAFFDSLTPSRAEELLAAGAENLTPEEVRDLIRQAIVGILSDLDPADQTARTYRRQFSTPWADRPR